LTFLSYYDTYNEEITIIGLVIMDTLRMFNLESRAAIITGAGRGIGRTLALSLASAGADIVVAELDSMLGQTVVEEIRGIGRKAIFIRTDVSSTDSTSEMAKKAFEKMGPIDILINNAGVVYNRQETGGDTSIPIEDTHAENWRHVMSVNIDGVFNCTKAVGSKMITEGNNGSIINIASMSGFIANRGRKNSAYCTSKGAVIMFTRQAAAEWGSRGIRVNAIAPGYIKTEGALALADPAVMNSIDEMTPLGRVGATEDLAGVAVFLASDASLFITGQTIIVDGGYTLW
jgi:NAD(P)-dependent dehydrogenase (short-subunit alcohol dehydrogenase family)